MLILGIDTSSKVDSCTLSLDGNIIATVTTMIPSLQSENILSLVDFVLQSTKIKIQQIDFIGVCTGPGSYTGIRIGIATALGLSKGSKAKVFGVDKFRIANFTGKEAYFEKKGLIYVKNSSALELGTKDGKISLDKLELTISDIIVRILFSDTSGPIEVIY